MKPVYWAYGTASLGSFLAFGVSLYLYGVTASFTTFLVRSMSVIFLTFVLIFTISFELTDVDN